MCLRTAGFWEDGASLALAGYQIRMISTPGHTAGGCCYYIEEEEVLFSGDTLFAGSVGRTDFPTGSMSTLVRSVKERLLSLPEDTQVYPGHMEANNDWDLKRRIIRFCKKTEEKYDDTDQQ